MAQEQKDCVMDAYAAYDADPRAHGPDDLDAFFDAVLRLLTPAPMMDRPPYVAAQEYCPVGQAWT